MWHIHRFTETERVYARSPLGTVSDFSAHGLGEKLDKLVLFGVTTILSKCCICGKLQTVEILGDARKPQTPGD
jgi:hypothetical protein